MAVEKSCAMGLLVLLSYRSYIVRGKVSSRTYLRELQSVVVTSFKCFLIHVLLQNIKRMSSNFLRYVNLLGMVHQHVNS